MPSKFWGDVATGFGPAYAASVARTDRLKAGELAQANWEAAQDVSRKRWEASEIARKEAIARAKAEAAAARAGRAAETRGIGGGEPVGGKGIPYVPSLRETERHDIGRITRSLELEKIQRQIEANRQERIRKAVQLGVPSDIITPPVGVMAPSADDPYAISRAMGERERQIPSEKLRLAETVKQDILGEQAFNYLRDIKKGTSTMRAFFEEYDPGKAALKLVDEADLDPKSEWVIEKEQAIWLHKMLEDTKLKLIQDTAKMSPSQRRIKDLLKLKYPDATDQELANYELAHWERKGLSPTDKGLSDMTKVASAWRKASAAMDAKLAKGEKPTPEEMEKFWDYEFEIQSFFGKTRMKVPQGVLETMKKVWRFPTAVVEEEVLGAQDVAIQAEQLIVDLDYLVEEFGQDQLNKHVGLWDKPLDDFRKTLGVAAGSKHFKALQSFKQVYQGILNETLKLRSGAAVTPSEWERFQKEIGVPTSADFYDRLRTFALKSRRVAKQRLQTRIKARYIFADEIQKEIMEGLAPLKPKEEGMIPDLPQGEPEVVEPITPMPTPPKKLSAGESVELETLVNKGVNKLTPAEKIKLKDLLLRQRNK